MRNWAAERHRQVLESWGCNGTPTRSSPSGRPACANLLCGGSERVQRGLPHSGWGRWRREQTAWSTPNHECGSYRRRVRIRLGRTAPGGPGKVDLTGMSWLIAGRERNHPPGMDEAWVSRCGIKASAQGVEFFNKRNGRERGQESLAADPRRPDREQMPHGQAKRPEKKPRAGYGNQER